MMSLAQILLSGLTVRGIYPGMNGREPRVRRKGGFICPPVAVESWMRKPHLRRENDAGTGVLDGIPYEMRPPAPK